MLLVAIMNALKLLTDQHADVDELFATLEKATTRERKNDLFVELADKLAAHATIEEKLFYPAVMARQTEELLLESVEEHLAIKRVLADLLDLDVEDPSFDAKLSVMKEEVTHHAHEEEEAELFPKVRKLLSADELDGLGGEMLAMFDQLMSGAPRQEVPAETSEAAHL